MSRIAKQLTDLIGNTPLLELTSISQKYGAYARIAAKLESFNPGGSVKDRTALSMIEDAEVLGQSYHPGRQLSNRQAEIQESV